MANEKLNDIWRMMKIYQFKVDDMNHDYICVICNHLLINAHSGPCGCRYCFDCITTYLNEEKFCPGIMEDCKEEKLSFSQNIKIDQAINKKMSKIFVKCINQSCIFRDQLRNIENHIRICDSMPVNCPYVQVGCKEVDIPNDTVPRHILDEIVSHSKMLLQSIDNLTNEMELLKLEIVELKIENQTLKNKVSVEKEKEVDQLSQSNSENISISNYTDDNSELSDDQSDVIVNLENMIEDLKLKLEKASEEEFVWCIDNYSKKKQQAESGNDIALLSEPFYSHKNGYKMCLQLYLCGNKFAKDKHMSFYFCLMQGPYDDILSWPFNQDVTLSLINQNLDGNCITKTKKFVNSPNNRNWNRPQRDRNAGIGFPNFISLLELSNHPTFSQNNKMFLRCVVKRSL